MHHSFTASNFSATSFSYIKPLRSVPTAPFTSEEFQVKLSFLFSSLFHDNITLPCCWKTKHNTIMIFTWSFSPSQPLAQDILSQNFFWQGCKRRPAMISLSIYKKRMSIKANGRKIARSSSLHYYFLHFLREWEDEDAKCWPHLFLSVCPLRIETP